MLGECMEAEELQAGAWVREVVEWAEVVHTEAGV